MWGWKTIETRTHDRFRSLEGQTIAIHAAKRFDDDAAALAWPYLTNEQRVEHGRRLLNLPKRFPAGYILGTAHVEKVRVCIPDDAERALIQCRTLRYGLFLGNVKPLVTPIPCKGRQGIFEVPESASGRFSD